MFLSPSQDEPQGIAQRAHAQADLWRETAAAAAQGLDFLPSLLRRRRGEPAPP